MALVDAVCAICGQVSFDEMYPASIQDPDKEPAQYYSSSRKKGGHLRIVRCPLCSLVLSSPRDDEPTISSIYTRLTDRVYDTADHGREHTARAHLKLVEKFVSPSAKILDVGCATGYFAGLAKEHGYDVTGVDPSLWAIETARKRYPQVDFHAGTLDSTGWPESSCAAVTMWDVLEHILTPSGTLDEVHRILEADGYLFLNLPNIESVTARLLGKRWMLLLREHLWYFSPRTIDLLLKRCGFEVVKVRANWVCFSIFNIIQRLEQYSKGTAWTGHAPSLLRHLDRIRLHFPMGEMLVVAQRI